MKIIKAVWKFIADSLEALAYDDTAEWRREQQEHDRRQKRWIEYLSRPP